MTHPARPTPASVVAIVDDDPSVRLALDNLISSVGLFAMSFGSPEEFLGWTFPDAPVCLILDVRMPGQNGLDLHQELLRSRSDLSVIFITGHGDIPMSVRAMKAGAIEFLAKPFRDQDLLDAIYLGLEKSQAARIRENAASAVKVRHQSLSSREREIFDLVVHGQLNKQIAARLNLSEITVKVTRARVMRKMEALSLADLVRMAETLKP